MHKVYVKYLPIISRHRGAKRFVGCYLRLSVVYLPLKTTNYRVFVHLQRQLSCICERKDVFNSSNPAKTPIFVVKKRYLHIKSSKITPLAGYFHKSNGLISLQKEELRLLIVLLECFSWICKPSTQLNRVKTQ